MNRLIEKLKNEYERLMHEPERNSRFVYLLQGLAVTVGILVLVGAFVAADAESKSEYPTMLLALIGGGAGASVGRFFTKKVGAQAPDVPKAPRVEGPTQ